MTYAKALRHIEMKFKFNFHFISFTFNGIFSELE